MKSVGKFLLLCIVYLVSLLAIYTIIGGIFSLLSLTGIGSFILNDLTGGWPDIGALLVSYSLTWGILSGLSQKINARYQFRLLGIVVLITCALGVIVGVISKTFPFEQLINAAFAFLFSKPFKNDTDDTSLKDTVPEDTQEMEQISIYDYALEAERTQAQEPERHAAPKKEKEIKKSTFAILLVLAILLGAVAAFVWTTIKKEVQNRYNSGYDAGYDKGYDYGYGVGKGKGYSIGYDVGHSDGYEEGQEFVWDDIGEEWEFLHYNAVLVTDTGNRYHRYDCYHITGREYWIYNIENAIYKGYKPCRDCLDE